MYALLVTVHAIVCVILILLVLIQAGRGAELGAAFGSVGQANSSRTPMNGVAKVTAAVAASFMVTSMLLAYLSSQKNHESVVKNKAVIAIEAKPNDPVATTTTATQSPNEKIVLPPAVPVPTTAMPENTTPPTDSAPVPQQP